MTRVSAALALLACLAGVGQAQEPLEEPREVRIGLLLADLISVQDAEQSFSADLFLVASWHDPELAGGEVLRTVALDDVWHPTLVIFNQRSVSESLPTEVAVRPDGSVTYLQRYTGTFSNPMTLKEFPLDHQEFSVWLVSPTRVGANVTLVPDDRTPTIRTGAMSISDWEIGEPSLEPRALQITPGGHENPGVVLTVPARRLIKYYTIQVLVPLIAVVMMAYAVFWIAPTVIPTRVGVVVTTMLTLIAYRFMLANHVPRLSYLTRLDWFMLGATVLVILTLFTMAGTSYLVSRDREALVKKIDLAGRWLYPLAFTIYSLVVWFG